LRPDQEPTGRLNRLAAGAARGLNLMPGQKADVTLLSNPLYIGRIPMKVGRQWRAQRFDATLVS
jgi:hypothetical protein